MGVIWHPMRDLDESLFRHVDPDRFVAIALAALFIIALLVAE
jgi:hypothetical protein